MLLLGGGQLLAFWFQNRKFASVALVIVIHKSSRMLTPELIAAPDTVIIGPSQTHMGFTLARWAIDDLRRNKLGEIPVLFVGTESGNIYKFTFSETGQTCNYRSLRGSRSDAVDLAAFGDLSVNQPFNLEGHFTTTEVVEIVLLTHRKVDIWPESTDDLKEIMSLYGAKYFSDILSRFKGEEQWVEDREELEQRLILPARSREITKEAEKLLRKLLEKGEYLTIAEAQTLDILTLRFESSAQRIRDEVLAQARQSAQLLRDEALKQAHQRNSDELERHSKKMVRAQRRSRSLDHDLGLSR
jgi:hypothetical protein